MSNILQTIEENSNAKSGIGFVRLAQKSGLSIANLKETLNGLHKERKIQVREGINEMLIFSLTKNQKQ